MGFLANDEKENVDPFVTLCYILKVRHKISNTSIMNLMNSVRIHKSETQYKYLD